MTKSQQAGGKKNRKLGRDGAKCKQYRDSHTREKNKVKRILKSNGEEAAKKYANENGIKLPK